MADLVFLAECPLCGWHHQNRAFAVGDEVRVLPVAEYEEQKPMDRWPTNGLVHGDRYAVVTSTIDTFSDIYRVRFAGSMTEQAEFRSCQLEHR